MNEHELYHYGVLGMKWGVRRNPSKTYAKAVRKREKLTDKSVKYELKGAKLEKKNRKMIKKGTNNPEMADAAASYKLKSARMKKKAHKLDKAIDKVFKDYTVERIPKGSVDAGKSHVYRLLYGDDSYNVTKRS